MKLVVNHYKVLLFSTVVCFAAGSQALAQTVGTVTTFATGTAVNSTAPDSITLDTVDKSIWVAYTNGANTTGLGGSSTVVQYSSTGTPLAMYTIAGSVDGLKFDPTTKQIWAMQNQDGYSTLTIIDPVKGITPSSPLSYAMASATRGYDDVVFQGTQIFVSYTNPVSPTDATIQMLTTLVSPIQSQDVLLGNATGTNLATGQTNQPTAQVDPDSLKPAPKGDLLLTSGSNAQLIFVSSPGTANQTVAFLNVLDSKGKPVSELDDAVFPIGTAGTFYVADTGNNKILAIPVTNITSGSIFASVGSMNAFVGISLKTGRSKALVSSFKGPGGILFVATK